MELAQFGEQMILGEGEVAMPNRPPFHRNASAVSIDRSCDGRSPDEQAKEFEPTGRRCAWVPRSPSPESDR